MHTSKSSSQDLKSKVGRPPLCDLTKAVVDHFPTRDTVSVHMLNFLLRGKKGKVADKASLAC